MSKLYTIFIFFALLGGPLSLTAQVANEADSCQGAKFLTLFSPPDQALLGTVMCKSYDGGLYTAGYVGVFEYVVLSKLDQNGQLVWTRKFFLPNGRFGYIRRLYEDSEGMLIITAPLLNSPMNYFFKYDPVADAILWAKRFYPGGSPEPYLIEHDSVYLLGFEDSFIDAVSFMEIDKHSGTYIPGSIVNLKLPSLSSLNFYSFEKQDSLLYIALENDGPALTLIRYNRESGNLGWAKSTQVTGGNSTGWTISGLLIEPDGIVTAMNSKIVSESPLILQKTDFQGNLLWLRQFDILDIQFERVLELARTESGYVLYANSINFTEDNFYFIKTDFEGQMEWARKFDYSAGDVTILFDCHGQCLGLDDDVCFIGAITNPGSDRDMVVGRLDKNGNTEEDCSYLFDAPVDTTLTISSEYMDIAVQTDSLLLYVPQPTVILHDTVSNFQSEVLCQRICAPDPGCDIKVNDCLTIELLDIGLYPDGDKRYRVRVTNNCQGREMDYVAIQLPQGVKAIQPSNGSSYVSDAGRVYEVRNPNYGPMYSIRFKGKGGGLPAGASDVFEYVLPPQAQPAYINVYAKMRPGPGYEVHLNTFKCPETPIAGSRSANDASIHPRVFPNPVARFAEVTLGGVTDGNWTLCHSNGQVLRRGVWEQTDRFSIEMDEAPAGLYFLYLDLPTGDRYPLRLVKQ